MTKASITMFQSEKSHFSSIAAVAAADVIKFASPEPEQLKS